MTSSSQLSFQQQLPPDRKSFLVKWNSILTQHCPCQKKSHQVSTKCLLHTKPENLQAEQRSPGYLSMHYLFLSPAFLKASLENRVFMGCSTRRRHDTLPTPTAFTQLPGYMSSSSRKFRLHCSKQSLPHLSFR